MASLAVGVGHSPTARPRLTPPFLWRVPPLASRATGVGHKEYSIAAMPSSGLPSAQHIPADAIPHLGQVGDNSAKEGTGKPGNGGSKEAWHVFSHHPAGLRQAHNTGEFIPEVPFVTAGLPQASQAVWLAGEAPADKVDGARLARVEGAHVVEARHIGPVAGQDLPRVGAVLDLPDRAHAGLLQAQLQAPNPAEEAPDANHGCTSRRGTILHGERERHQKGAGTW